MRGMNASEHRQYGQQPPWQHGIISHVSLSSLFDRLKKTTLKATCDCDCLALCLFGIDSAGVLPCRRRPQMLVCCSESTECPNRTFALEYDSEPEFSVDCFCSAIFSDNGSCRCRNWSCMHPACEL